MSTTLKKRPVILKKPKQPITLGQEVDALVEEWYKALGQSVPEEERNLAQILDKQREEEWKELEKISRLQAGEVVLDAEGKPEPPIASGQKPEFGTPEFWAWARRRKAEKEAEENAKRVEKGLAPLPTSKKEREAALAAEKAAKEKEKENAKLAKATEKAAKEAAKVMKAAAKAAKKA
jgi:hypothetical protein